MATHEEMAEDLRQLKRTMRELVALSMLPAAWVGYEAETIADSLADVMLKTLALDLIYIQFQASTGENSVEVVRTRHANASPDLAFQALSPWAALDNAGLPDRIANPFGEGQLRIATTRFGHAGRFGVMVTASQRADFPSESDRLLLGLSANQTAVVLQRKRVEEQVRHESAERQQAERALYESQQRLVSLVESSYDAIVSKSLDGIIQTWNKSAERLYGYPAAEAIGQHISFMIPADRRDEEDHILSRIRAGERVDHFDTERVRKDGRIVQVSLTISPIKDQAGRVIGASKIARDITERKRLEEELRRTAAELSEADRRKTEFLALLAHELRSPLAPISNALHILRIGENDPDAVKSAADMMDRQVGQLVRLVEDLLDVSRISRGKIELRRKLIELGPVVHQAVEAARPPCEAEGHTLTAQLPATPIYLHADPARIVQIVGNLLNNACKFTPRGGSITLAIECRDGHALIRVRDTGIGIATDQLPYIFEMFRQVDTSLERTEGGLGLGLSLVKNLAELHGGAVEANSPGVGQGSEFVIRLPITADAPGPAPETPVGQLPASTRCHRILVVDDNRDSANSLAVLLRMHGNQVEVAHDGLAALDLAEKLLPEIILLDIGLPKLNGYEVCRCIRREPWGKNVRIVALTGWGNEADRQRTHAAGFDRHLVKPIELKALREVLAQESNAP